MTQGRIVVPCLRFDDVKLRKWAKKRKGRLTPKLSRRPHNGAGARPVNNIGGGKGSLLAAALCSVGAERRPCPLREAAIEPSRKQDDRPTEMLGTGLASFPASLCGGRLQRFVRRPGVLAVKQGLDGA